MSAARHPTSAAVVLIACLVACATRSGFSPSTTPSASPASPFVGSAACASCHSAIYERWKKTPMANVVRDPREHPDAVVADWATNTVHPFALEDVALVYGSRWKQRYFTKIGDDYFVEPAQWDVTHSVWRPYFVERGTDWWATLYPPDNMKRPTGPLCDGCHSVGYDVRIKKVAEWNVGCEQCHGGGAVHAAKPSRTNILNPARMDDTHADDTCIQCHSQGRPLVNPIEGRTYDWPVGYRVGLDLQDYWRLETHTLGETTFTHFADGSAHKNRMQGNDYVQSVMFRHGVTCSSCHDVHGTDHPAQLRRAGNALCLGCHEPGGPNGPKAATLVEHTGHAAASEGSQCVACHMPKIATTIADVRVRSHTFQFIAPSVTDKHGVANPCTSCHANRTTAWAADVLRRGPERTPWRAD